ncbi:MAG: class I SAM-dependent methyltransferase [Solirubrobacteraceae bacterium]
MSTWPKTLPPLTEEQARIHDDFMKQWHEVLPQRYGIVERFNHTFPVRHSRPGFRRTLEIGAGLGEHIHYERLTPEQEHDYHALEMRKNMAEQIHANHPGVRVIVGDCQARLDFPDGHFDRYIAVHVLEHLPDLPACLREAWRLLDKDRGQLLVVIPCEGSPAYTLARRISAQRIFERTYGMPYGPFIAREHINAPAEIIAELERHFTVERRRFFPLPFAPLVAANLCIGLALRPRLHMQIP